MNKRPYLNFLNMKRIFEKKNKNLYCLTKLPNTLKYNEYFE